MSVHLSTFPSITPKTLSLYIPSEETSENPSIHKLQAPTGFPSVFPSIQYSDSPSHVTGMYSRSRPNDGTSNIKISHTILNPSVSLSQNPSNPTSAHLSPFLLEFSPLNLTIIFE